MSQKETKTIGKDYTLGGLLKFALPAVLNEFMFNLLYTLDDGLFITRYVGTTAESAFSIIFPVFMVQCHRFFIEWRCRSGCQEDGGEKG